MPPVSLMVNIIDEQSIQLLQALLIVRQPHRYRETECQKGVRSKRQEMVIAYD